MGTKRVGLARVEALMENLKRELTLGDGAALTVGANGHLIPNIPDAAVEDLSGAGAVSVACYHTRYTSTGAGEALTLADGTAKGQLKKITHVVDAGDGALTIASPVSAGTDTITFADLGDEAELMWNGTAWRIIALKRGDTDAGPAVS